MPTDDRIPPEGFFARHVARWLAGREFHDIHPKLWRFIPPPFQVAWFSGNCTQCGERFRVHLGLDAVVRYCGKACQQKAYRARRAARKVVPLIEPEEVEPASVVGLEGCPRPDKRIYLTRADAESRRAASWRHDPTIKSYLCRCGFWHLGHPVTERETA